MSQVERARESFLTSYALQRFRLSHPEKLLKEDLFGRVLRATRAIGIEDAAIVEWDMNLMAADSTWGILCERQYLRPAVGTNHEKDVGYFVKRGQNGLYTVRSFAYNPWAFSEERANAFRTVLDKQGLETEAHSLTHHDCPQDAEMRTGEKRAILYR